jgi:hypothetical protein
MKKEKQRPRDEITAQSDNYNYGATPRFILEVLLDIRDLLVTLTNK